MKHIIPQFDKILPITRRLCRHLVTGSVIGAEVAVKAARWAIAAYPGLPLLAKTGVHIAVCITFLWVVVGSGKPSPTSEAAAGRTPIPEAAGEPFSKPNEADAARKILSDAQRKAEIEMAEEQRIHAEQQHRLAVEEAAANREREAYLEQARYLQQLEMQQQQSAQQYQYEAQQDASERANYEMQRYRSQMTGRPGF